jgi:2-polyprenyl-3-methyl-5-hydroxy-6-metoxy-1,4-benzoquinol methylase
LPTVEDVKKYWDNHPLLSHELANVGSEAFYEQFDKIKRNDSDRFALKYWSFNQFKEKKLLDIGCGPGWLTVNYALGGASVYAIDLTPKAVELTKKHLLYRNVEAIVQEADAEDLPFEDEFFDVIIS